MAAKTCWDSWEMVQEALSEGRAGKGLCPMVAVMWAQKWNPPALSAAESVRAPPTRVRRAPTLSFTPHAHVAYHVAVSLRVGAVRTQGFDHRSLSLLSLSRSR